MSKLSTTAANCRLTLPLQHNQKHHMMNVEVLLELKVLLELTVWTTSDINPQRNNHVPALWIEAYVTGNDRVNKRDPLFIAVIVISNKHLKFC